MTVSAVSFVTDYYPEFLDAGPTLVQKALDDALLRTDVDIFASLADRAQAVKAATILARMPFGINARMLSKTGRSTYDDEWDNLARMNAAGGLVL